LVSPALYRPCAAPRWRVANASVGRDIVVGTGGYKQVAAGTDGKCRRYLRRDKMQRHVPMVLVQNGSEVKSRGEERGGEKQRTLGSEGGERDKERESNLLVLNRRHHPSSVPPRPLARRLVPRRRRVAPCARLAAGARAAPPVVAESSWRAAEKGRRVAPHLACGRLAGAR